MIKEPFQFTKTILTFKIFTAQRKRRASFGKTETGLQSTDTTLFDNSCMALGSWKAR